MRVFILDNYDSFTYNIAQSLQKLGIKILVKRANQTSIKKIKKFSPQRIIISPGPMSPKEHPFIFTVIKNFYRKIPILGICLGMQAINEFFGGKTKKAPQPVHGKVSAIFHNQNGIFSGLPLPFSGARYHSLIIDKVPPELLITAYAKNPPLIPPFKKGGSGGFKNIPMAIKHKKYPVFGVQFHPESFLTPDGEKIFKNFLKIYDQQIFTKNKKNNSKKI